jgi:hypothetical protein
MNSEYENDIKKNGFGFISDSKNTGISRKGNLLIMDKENLINMIKNNSDKNSFEIDEKLIKLIYNYWGRFSVKQSNWICEKIKYICRHNICYKEYKGITDVQLL